MPLTLILAQHSSQRSLALEPPPSPYKADSQGFPKGTILLEIVNERGTPPKQHLVLEQPDLDRKYAAAYEGFESGVCYPHGQYISSPNTIAVSVYKQGEAILHVTAEPGKRVLIPNLLPGRYDIIGYTTVQHDSEITVPTSAKLRGTIPNPLNYLNDGEDESGKYEIAFIQIISDPGTETISFKFTKRYTFQVIARTTTYVDAGEDDRAVLVFPLLASSLMPPRTKMQYRLELPESSAWTTAAAKKLTAKVAESILDKSQFATTAFSQLSDPTFGRALAAGYAANIVFAGFQATEFSAAPREIAIALSKSTLSTVTIHTITLAFPSALSVSAVVPVVASIGVAVAIDEAVAAWQWDALYAYMTRAYADDLLAIKSVDGTFTTLEILNMGAPLTDLQLATAIREPLAPFGISTLPYALHAPSGVLSAGSSWVASKVDNTWFTDGILSQPAILFQPFPMGLTESPQTSILFKEVIQARSRPTGKITGVLKGAPKDAGISWQLHVPPLQRTYNALPVAANESYSTFSFDFIPYSFAAHLDVFSYGVKIMTASNLAILDPYLFLDLNAPPTVPLKVRCSKSDGTPLPNLMVTLVGTDPITATMHPFKRTATDLNGQAFFSIWPSLETASGYQIEVYKGDQLLARRDGISPLAQTNSSDFEISGLDANPSVATVSLLSDPPEAGYVRGGGVYSIGSSIEVEASPNSGWIFSGWNDGSPSPRRMLLVPKVGMNLVAKFSKRLPIHVSTGVLGSQGTGRVQGGGLYNPGDRIRLVAIPNPGSYFVAWESADRYRLNVRYDAPPLDYLDFTVPSTNVTIYATFGTGPIGDVYVNANIAEAASLTGGGRYHTGAIPSLRAWVKDGFEFLYWSDGKRSNPRKIDVTEGQVRYTAVMTRSPRSSVLKWTTQSEDLPPGTINDYYRFALSDWLSLRECSFTVVSGSLPKGLTLHSYGVVSGTPLQVESMQFRVRVEHRLGLSIEQDFALSIHSSTASDELRLRNSWPGYSRGYVRAFAVDDRYAYVALSESFYYRHSSLIVVDYSNLQNPLIVGGCALPQEASSMVVNGEEVWISGKWQGVLLVNVSDPVRPSIQGTFGPSSTISEIAFIGQDTYLSTGAGITYKATGPRSASMDFVPFLNGSAFSVSISSDARYIAVASSTEEIEIFEMFSDERLVRLGSVNIFGELCKFWYESGYLYVVSQTPVVAGAGYNEDFSRLSAYRISSGSFPQRTGTLDFRNGEHGNRFSSAGSLGSVTVLSTQSSTSLIQTEPSGGLVLEGQISKHLGDLKLDSRGLLWTSSVDGFYSRQGLSVRDLSKRGNLKQIGYCLTDGYASDVIAWGNYAYVNDLGNGLQFLELRPTGSIGVLGSYMIGRDKMARYVASTDSELGLAYLDHIGDGIWRSHVHTLRRDAGLVPVFESSFTLDEEISGLALLQDYALIANGYDRVHVLRRDKSGSWPEVSRFVPGGKPAALWVFGSLAFIDVESDVISVVDFSDPEAPREVGMLDIGGSGVRDMAFDDRRAFLVSYDGIRILDLADPRHPRLVGRNHQVLDPRAIAIWRDRGYVADAGHGIRIMDLRDLTSPKIVSTVRTQGGAIDISASFGHLWVALARGGTSVYSISSYETFRSFGYANGQLLLEWDSRLGPDVRLLSTTNLSGGRWTEVFFDRGASAVSMPAREAAQYFQLQRR